MADLENGVLRIYQSKGRNDRLVYLPDDLRQLCCEYLKTMTVKYKIRSECFFLSPIRQKYCRLLPSGSVSAWRGAKDLTFTKSGLNNCFMIRSRPRITVTGWTRERRSRCLISPDMWPRMGTGMISGRRIVTGNGSRGTGRCSIMRCLIKKGMESIFGGVRKNNRATAFIKY